MDGSPAAKRLEGLPTVKVGGITVPVAVGFRSRLLGLAHLDRERAGPGLLIPRCSSVHTFGMRFELDVHFLDERGRTVATRTGVPPRQLVGHRRAAAVLELPAVAGSGKFATGGGESPGASAG
jgi:uncharacterized membrane protein (UPF0127 family)